MHLISEEFTFPCSIYKGGSPLQKEGGTDEGSVEGTTWEG
jgi:hypothetical protein